MSDNVPRLTGGILFGLILEAKKSRTRVRSNKLNCVEIDKSDGLNEDDMMLSFIENFTGESISKPKGTSFKKNVSDYKKCVISATTYLTFDDQTFIDSFETSVKQNKKDTLESMSAFISNKISEQKLEWFASAIIETICNDETIDISERFKVSANKELPKEPQEEFSLPALTSSFMNQGLNYYVPKEGATVLQNVISIPSNSDVYRAYFQSQEFTVLSDAYAIDWIGSDKQLRPNDYLFIVPSINKVTDLPIYSYKNKLGGWNVVKDKLIKLPVNEKGEIHFDYMATLVQAIKKLAIKDVVLYADKQIEATKEVVAK